ncbi:MAG TPA: hypothetical protein VJP79_07260 [Nitrososphaera sp.]|nr:hypothetical protein [Nitrososphaera sp.]
MTGPGSTAIALRMVFSDKTYLAVAAVSALGLWIIFNILDGLILLSPTVTFYFPIPEDAIGGFCLSIVTAVLAGIVLSLNIFLFRTGLKVGKTSFLSGSTLGTISSMCASCSSVGFYAASTFGAAGVAASSLLSNYQLPLRIVSVGILLMAFYTAQRKIGTSCKIST